MARLYQNIKVYHLAYNFVLEVYDKTKKFPKSEELNLTSQLRRAAVSIPLNIVEGSAKASKKEFVRYLNIAYASAKEVEVILNLSSDLGYLEIKDYKTLSLKLDELNAKLFLFLRDVESKVKSKREQFFRRFEEKMR